MDFYAILVQIYALYFFTIYIFANTIKKTEFKHRFVSSFIRSYNIMTIVFSVFYYYILLLLLLLLLYTILLHIIILLYIMRILGTFKASDFKEMCKNPQFRGCSMDWNIC